MAKKKRKYGVKPGKTTSPQPAADQTPQPAAPNKVDPFFTPEDLAAINDFTTNYLTSLQNLDFSLDQQRIDTDYQKSQTDANAKKATATTADDMAARGLFRSSIKDAALYDIEAQRALAQKFLDDRMTSATLNAGTQKQLLADSKQRFDSAMAAKQTANAQGVNDQNNQAWAEAMAAWVQAHPAGPKPAVQPTSAPTVAAKPKLAVPPQAVADRAQQEAAHAHALAVAQAHAQRARKPHRLTAPTRAY